MANAVKADPMCTRPTNVGICNPDGYQWWVWYWQEIRHPYYSSLPAGDGADLLPALYRLYNDTLQVNLARSISWYNHSGASFVERFTLLGLFDEPTPPRDSDPRNCCWGPGNNYYCKSIV
jgi:hypothetical protein